MEEKNIQPKKKDYLLPISIVLAAVIIGGAFIYSKGLNEQRQQAAVDENGAVADNVVKLGIESDQVVLGKADAPVTIFEFADYQCPYCKRFHLLSYLDIVKDYVDTGLVKMVFIDVPLPIHEFAQKASEAAWCAKDQDQNKFWEMHDKMFESSDSANGLKADALIQYAKDLGLNGDVFSDCLNSNKYALRVQQSLNLASQLGINGTPSIIITKTDKLPLKINSQLIQAAFQGSSYQTDLGGASLIIGAQPYSVIKSVIDEFVK